MIWLMLAVVAGLYLAVTCVVFFAQEKMLFFPRDTPVSNVRHYESIAWEIKNDGIALRGWLLNPGKEKVVIYYGGNGEELSYVISEFKSYQNFSVLLVNYRGYGQSEGSPGQDELFSDALAIYDKVSKDYDQVIVIGRSLGSGIATYVTSQREVSAVGLITPYDSIKAVGQKSLPFLPIGLILKHPFNSVDLAPKINVPAMFVIAGKDEVIPKESSQRLYDAWGGEKEWNEQDFHTHNSFSMSGGRKLLEFLDSVPAKE